VAHDVVRYGEAQQIDVGILIMEISHWLAQRLEITDRNGLIVSQVAAGSTGDEAGVQVADIIRAIDGRRVTTRRQAVRTIFGAQVGDTITLTIEREGELKDIPVIVAAAKP